MTVFDTAAAALFAAVDAAFGERVRIVPVSPGGYRVAGEDPSRPPHEAVAVITDEVEPVAVRGARVSDADRISPTAPQCTAAFQAAALTHPLRQGDRLERLARPDSPSYRIVSVNPDGQGRVVAALQRLST